MSVNQAFLDSRESAGEAGTEATSAVGRELSASRMRAAKALFLLAAGVSFLLSVFLWFLVDREQGLFVGLWVPSILSLGGLLMNRGGGER